jgi:hypothetical protein
MGSAINLRQTLEKYALYWANFKALAVEPLTAALFQCRKSLLANARLRAVEVELGDRWLPGRDLVVLVVVKSHLGQVHLRAIEHLRLPEVEEVAAILSCRPRHRKTLMIF